MAHGQGATSNRRGGRGPMSRGPRGHGTDKAVRKAQRRQHDERLQEAQAATRKHQEELDALIAHQKEHPAVGETAGAQHARELIAKQKEVDESRRKEMFVGKDPKPEPIKKAAPKRKGFNTKTLKQTGDGNFPFAPTTAKLMLKSGYHIKHVIKFTGVGYEELSHIELDDEGYGIVQSEDLAS